MKSIQRSGQTVKLINPQFVTPFVKTNKNDANDAQAIAEARNRHDRLHAKPNENLIVEVKRLLTGIASKWAGPAVMGRDLPVEILPRDQPVLLKTGRSGSMKTLS